MGTTTIINCIDEFTASPRAFSKSHQRNFLKKEFQTIEENMKILLGNKNLFFLFAFLFYLAAYNQLKKKKTIICSSVPFKKKLKKFLSKRYKFKPVRDKIIVKNQLFHIPLFSKNPLPPLDTNTHTVFKFFHPC